MELHNLITVGKWEIEPEFGLTELSKYLNDMYLIQSGSASLRELGYTSQRESLQSKIFNYSESFDMSSTDIPQGSIAHLNLSGVMRLEDGWCTQGVRSLMNDIRKADMNDNISGIVIEVNSGGGESIAGTELMNTLLDVKRRGQTKVVAYVQQMASAALRAMLPVDRIIASSKSASIGSIGTYTSINKKMLDAIKENYSDVYARQSTSKNNEYRELLKGNFEPLIDSLSNNAQSFIDDVFDQKTLSGTETQIEQVKAGKVFQAREAKQIGLIDEIGTFNDAIKSLNNIISKNNSYSGGVNYQNNMKEFLLNLIPSLNNKLNLEITEEANQDEVIEALDQAQEIEELTNQINELKEDKQRLVEENNELNNQITKLNNDISNLTESVNALKDELINFKGRSHQVAADGTSSLKNSGTVNHQQFETVSQFGLVKSEGAIKIGDE